MIRYYALQMAFMCAQQKQGLCKSINFALNKTTFTELHKGADRNTESVQD